VNDPAEEITDALVEYVNGLESPDVSLTAQVRKTDNPLGELEFENTDLTVLFYAAEESATKAGRNTFQEDFTIAMLVVRKMDVEFTRPVLARFVRELKRAVRGVKMAGYTLSMDDTPVKMDPTHRKELNQFVSVSHFVYTGFAPCG